MSVSDCVTVCVCSASHLSARFRSLLLKCRSVTNYSFIRLWLRIRTDTYSHSDTQTIPQTDRCINIKWDRLVPSPFFFFSDSSEYTMISFFILKCSSFYLSFSFVPLSLFTLSVSVCCTTEQVKLCAWTASPYIGRCQSLNTSWTWGSSPAKTGLWLAVVNKHSPMLSLVFNLIFSLH